MSDTECEEMIAELEALVLGISAMDCAAQFAAVDGWLDSKRQSPYFRSALRLVGIYKARGEIHIHTGALYVKAGVIAMEDKSITVSTGGGDITGSAIGHNASVLAEQITKINTAIDNSTSIDASVQKNFRDAVNEIAGGTWTDTEKAELLRDLEQVRNQVASQSPSITLLKKSWGAIWAVAKELPTIVKLGTWIGTTYPDVVAGLLT